MPLNDLSGKARVIDAIFASESGRIAGPPMPPLDTKPSTLISNSIVSGSIGGREGNVFEETIASAPPRKHAAASSTMSVVDGVSLHHTGTRATSFTASETVELSPSSLPMLDPMSLRSMCGHEKLSSSASAPASWQPRASSCQAWCSLSLPEPAMMEATTTLCGYDAFNRSITGIHQSRGLSEISSQFHDECRAAPGRFFIEISFVSGVVRMNLVRAPYTLTTGCRPIVFTTTPPQPASNARRMLFSDSVGGAEDSKNGFSNFTPVKTTAVSTAIGAPSRLG